MHIKDGSRTEIVKKCWDISQLKGIEALRLSYLHDGTNKENIPIPPLDIFVQTHYKQYEIEDIPIKRIHAMVSLNSFSHKHEENKRGYKSQED